MLRVTLVCVGRAKAGAERDLAERYFDRARVAGRSVGLSFEMCELEESRARRPDDRKADEAAAIREVIGPGVRLYALDEGGQVITSQVFSGLLAAARDDCIGRIALIIGGPDGLASELRRDAHMVIAYGAQTWPHQLVRIMASEQLYRAVTILTGHPYHRA